MATRQKLSKYERDVQKSLERKEWKSISNRGGEVEKSVKAAQEQIASQKKEARVSLRLSSGDVEKIREKAFRIGLPYQTLIASVIHQFATDQLVDRSIVEELKDTIRTEKKAV